jgi:hypothetical protein
MTLDRLRNMVSQPFALPPSVRGLAVRLAGLAEPLQPYFERAQKTVAPAWEAAHGWFEKREPREKVLLRLLGAFVGVLLLYELFFAPIVDLRQSLADRVITRRNDLLTVHDLMNTYGRLQRELAAAQNRTVPSGPNFSLFSVVEQTLTKSVGRDRIGSLTPSDHAVSGGFRQYTVDVKLSGISLAQVVDALYGVQSMAMPVSVSHLELRPRTGDTHSYDVNMTCMSLGKDEH